MSENDFWNYVRQELKVEFSNEQIFEKLRNSYTINEDVQKVVQKVRDLGLKTCICSNNFPTRIREINNRYNFLTDFDIKIFSFEVGAAKPNVEIFKALVKASGVSADEILYSDDHLEVLEGAQAIGINAFVFEGFDKFVEKLREYGVAV